jgi:hypothetical protein
MVRDCNNCSWIHIGIRLGSELVVGSFWVRSFGPVEEEKMMQNDRIEKKIKIIPGLVAET